MKQLKQFFCFFFLLLLGILLASPHFVLAEQLVYNPVISTPYLQPGGGNVIYHYTDAELKDKNIIVLHGIGCFDIHWLDKAYMAKTLGVPESTIFDYNYDARFLNGKNQCYAPNFWQKLKMPGELFRYVGFRLFTLSGASILTERKKLEESSFSEMMKCTCGSVYGQPIMGRQDYIRKVACDGIIYRKKFAAPIQADFNAIITRIEQLNPTKPIVVIGFSLGSVVAYETFQKYPAHKRVNLVAIGSPLDGPSFETAYLNTQTKRLTKGVKINKIVASKLNAFYNICGTMDPICGGGQLRKAISNRQHVYYVSPNTHLLTPFMANDQTYAQAIKAFDASLKASGKDGIFR
jgi:pimeloyl-ACP methyl ester carboxylesterase